MDSIKKLFRIGLSNYCRIAFDCQNKLMKPGSYEKQKISQPAVSMAVRRGRQLISRNSYTLKD